MTAREQVLAVYPMAYYRTRGAGFDIILPRSAKSPRWVIGYGPTEDVAWSDAAARVNIGDKS